MLRATTSLALLGVLFATAPAHAADDASKDKSDKKSDASPDDITRVDGIAECKLFREANEREKHIWESTRPAVPYAYPDRDTVLDAPWGKLLKAMGDNFGLLAATFTPHLNAVLRSLEPEPGLSWPLQAALGPVMTCSRRPGTYDVDVYRPIRLLLEPGLLVGGDHSVAFFVRPGARFMYHPSSWVVGVGGGVGTMLELSGKEPARASFSPEGVLQLGHCCDPGYVTLAVRRDFFFAGRTQIWAATVGFTYF